MPSHQAVYWLLTIPHHCFLPYLPPGCVYLAGQVEEGGQTGYRHWQLICAFDRKSTLKRVKDVFGNECHAEPSRSQAARDYCFKDDTAVQGTRFELGTYPVRRNNARDWQAVLERARNDEINEIDPEIVIRHYGNLRRIAQDNLQPLAIERKVHVYWGRTGAGKSRRAWAEAGLDAYPKDPRSKFWDGYRGHRHVVIDEFRGGIDIAHLLRWFDRYPTIVEVKGSSTVLKAEHIWITSNLNPRLWYPDLDDETWNALKRRLEITEFVL